MPCAHQRMWHVVSLNGHQGRTAEHLAAPEPRSQAAEHGLVRVVVDLGSQPDLVVLVELVAWKAARPRLVSCQLSLYTRWAVWSSVKRSWRDGPRATAVHRRSPAVTLVARVVAPQLRLTLPQTAPRAAELAAHQPRSGSLPCDQFDQYCEVRLAAKANDDTHKSMLSCLGSWRRGQPGARPSFPDDH